MINQEQLAWLKSGAVGWNEWRDAANTEAIVLEGADLRGCMLRGIDLSKALLTRAKLAGADLGGAMLAEAELMEADLSSASFESAFLMAADLSGADLRGIYMMGAWLAESNLTGADLRGGDLTNATLLDADLSGADLRGAFLKWTDMSNAVLRGANLSGAYLAGTMLANLDLRGVQGLEDVVHQLPSTVGIDTIFRSHGELPADFLRGAGVPDVFVDYMPALIGALQPIQYYSCFISHSSVDASLAQRIHADLQAVGVRSWLAETDFRTGDRIRQTIDNAIRTHDKLLIVLSEASVGSQWVEDEVESALELERQSADRSEVLFPIRIDEAVMVTGKAWASTLRRVRHICDFRGWEDDHRYAVALARLLRDLRASS
jgi:uncharacterized protein YjbI with pentapeptide repeats